MKKIAIINNDADFISAMEALLHEFGGYGTLMIHEGNLAYHQVKKEKPDLIVLDIRMEEPTTGWKVLDLLTLDPETSTIPVIICTASIDLITPEKEIWLQEHGISVLPKPFDVSDLMTMVTAMVTPRKRKKLPVAEEAN